MNVTYFVLYGTCHLDELFPTRYSCSKPMNALSLADERVHIEFFDDRADWLRSQRKLLSASPSFKLPRGQTAIGTLNGEYSVRSVPPLTPTGNGT